jgi:hypothetical protein
VEGELLPTDHAAGAWEHIGLPQSFPGSPTPKKTRSWCSGSAVYVPRLKKRPRTERQWRHRMKTPRDRNHNADEVAPYLLKEHHRHQSYRNIFTNTFVVPFATPWHVARFTSSRLFHYSKKKHRTWTAPSLPAFGCGVHAAYTDVRRAWHEREELFGK